MERSNSEDMSARPEDNGQQQRAPRWSESDIDKQERYARGEFGSPEPDSLFVSEVPIDYPQVMEDREIRLAEQGRQPEAQEGRGDIDNDDVQSSANSLLDEDAAPAVHDHDHPPTPQDNASTTPDQDGDASSAPSEDLNPEDVDSDTIVVKHLSQREQSIRKRKAEEAAEHNQAQPRSSVRLTAELATALHLVGTNNDEGVEDDGNGCLGLRRSERLLRKRQADASVSDTNSDDDAVPGHDNGAVGGRTSEKQREKRQTKEPFSNTNSEGGAIAGGNNTASSPRLFGPLENRGRGAMASRGPGFRLAALIRTLGMDWRNARREYRDAQAMLRNLRNDHSSSESDTSDIELPPKRK